MGDRELARPARMRRAGNDECETSRGSTCDGAYEVRMLCSADPSHRRGRDPETNLGYRTPCNRDITFNTSVKELHATDSLSNFVDTVSSETGQTGAHDTRTGACTGERKHRDTAIPSAAKTSLAHLFRDSFGQRSAWSAHRHRFAGGCLSFCGLAHHHASHATAPDDAPGSPVRALRKSGPRAGIFHARSALEGPLESRWEGACPHRAATLPHRRLPQFPVAHPCWRTGKESGTQTQDRYSPQSIAAHDHHGQGF